MKRITYIVLAFGIVAMAAGSSRAAEPSDKAPVQQVRDDPQSGIAYGTNRAQTFAFYDNRARGWLAQNDYDKAIADYNQALQVLHSYDTTNLATTYSNRAVIWHLKGEYEKAIADYNQAIALNPADAYAYNNRGFAWNAKGDYDKALVDYNQAIALNPGIENTYRHRGDVWRAKGEFDKAIADDNQALAINPAGAAAYDDRGNAWNMKGEYEKAKADYSKAISIDANNPAYYNDLALLQATSLDPGFRDAKQAFANASKAFQLANGSNANGTFSALAAAYAENGDFTKAVEWQAKGIDLTKNNELKQRYLARLELFKQGKPFRMDPKAAAKASAPSVSK